MIIPEAQTKYKVDNSQTPKIRKSGRKLALGEDGGLKEETGNERSTNSKEN